MFVHRAFSFCKNLSVKNRSTALQMQTEYFVSAEKSLLDLDVIHGFLTNCHWAKGISRELVEKSIRNSLCFGVYEVAQGVKKQIGFARVISDFATFAYLSDVFVLESYRGNDLSKRLLSEIMKHPDLQGFAAGCSLQPTRTGFTNSLGFLRRSILKRLWKFSFRTFTKNKQSCSARLILHKT